MYVLYGTRARDREGISGVIRGWAGACTCMGGAELVLLETFNFGHCACVVCFGYERGVVMVHENILSEPEPEA